MTDDRWPEVLRRVDDLSPDELLRLSVRGSDTEQQALATARTTAARVGRETGVGERLDAAASAVAQWTQVGGARAGTMSLAQAPASLRLSDLRSEAAGAVLDLLVTEILGDSLPEGARSALLGPWRGLGFLDEPIA